jgi:hypothetical protein
MSPLDQRFATVAFAWAELRKVGRFKRNVKSGDMNQTTNSTKSARPARPAALVQGEPNPCFFLVNELERLGARGLDKAPSHRVIHTEWRGHEAQHL